MRSFICLKEMSTLWFCVSSHKKQCLRGRGRVTLQVAHETQARMLQMTPIFYGPSPVEPLRLPTCSLQTRQSGPGPGRPQFLKTFGQDFLDPGARPSCLSLSAEGNMILWGNTHAELLQLQGFEAMASRAARKSTPFPNTTSRCLMTSGNQTRKT